MKVSVVLPTYNESGNIVELVQQIAMNLVKESDYEILVVDDNSPDKTFELVQRTFAQDQRVRPILRTENRGLANSIRTGIDHASGDQLIIMDTDFTHDPKEIPKMLHIAQVYDIVSGSRFCPGGSMQDTTHYIASRLYNELMRLVIRTQIQDNLGGYFTVPTAKVRSLPLDLIFFGYGDYFFRFLHYAERAGMTVVEIPALYAGRKKGVSKSNFFKMLFTYTWAMIQMKRQMAKYERKQALLSQQLSVADSVS